MRLRTFFLMLALVITGAASVNAQVLIGERANGNPHNGAILDLAPPNGQNLGLLLPNVELSDDASEFALGSNVDSDQLPAARGMLVYNTATVPNGRGLYVWEGSKWLPVATEPVKVTSFGVTPSYNSVHIYAGDELTFTVGNFQPADATVKGVNWTVGSGDDYIGINPGATTTSCTIQGITEGAAVLQVSGIDGNTSYNIAIEVHPTYSSECANSFSDIRDGNSYCIGDFGDAGTWMTQNLRYQPESGFAYPNNSGAVFDNNKVYGLLYDWETATGRTAGIADERNTDHGPHQGICPEGWHIPSHKEWLTLVDEIDAEATKYSDIELTNEAGTKMKSSTLVNGIATNGHSKPGSEGGFDALLVGMIIPPWGVDSYGSMGVFWASSTQGSEFACMLMLFTGDKIASDGGTYLSEFESVRCKQTK